MAKSGWCLTTDHVHCQYRGCLCPCHPERTPSAPAPQTPKDQT
jgi:hypothetical protein